ncbi:hypothetical protein CMV30_06595 [Nibricoccus aquaticus]|uniref:Histidine kinase n=1 Tax=Nibricoccus aquaticus TaxID=2576891 RepID=A0A290Q4N1_9BACT|nr:FIST N-terminal domain-containing protein [Nibricoccus aquaticus]ATC63645.1 hypothetical protein CMV30_06595 [Nibricoccus aquaticus]
MKIHTLSWQPGSGWNRPPSSVTGPVQLILYFGGRDVLAQPDSPVHALHAAFPDAVCAGCSSAGEITGQTVGDDGLVASLIMFEHATVRGASVAVASPQDSFSAGRELGAQLVAPGLRHVLVLSDGLKVNGTTLTAGLREALPAGVLASGGLAGDGARFEKTFVGLGNDIGAQKVVGIGFYGARLNIAPGSAGGWEPFGPTRLITRSEGNVLYSLDDQPALAVYKRYLGELADKLPSSGLLFPLQLLSRRDEKEGVVRTILAVDEATQSLVFAGDLPQGQYARLMKANCDALVTGAENAAAMALREGGDATRLVVLVSCVGRKLVMGQRVEEEVEAVVGRMGSNASAVGFYSYGEISPSGLVHGCDLHNQTMTLTVFEET